MSLIDISKHLESKGRGQDSVLVHMTPGEVQALQAMAEQHGGSLTINPKTGLPEAGFLGNLLSIAAPIALSFTGIPGAIGASLGAAQGSALATGLGMGLLTGGMTALATGDIGKGLTSGLTSGVLSGAMESFNPTAASAPGAATTTPGTPTVALEALKNPAAYSQGINLTGTADPFAGIGQIGNTAVAQGANVVTPAYQSMMQAPSVRWAGAPLAETVQAAAPVSQAVASAGSNAAPGISLANYGLPAAQATSPDLLQRFKDLSMPAKLGIGAAGLGVLGALSQPEGKTQEISKGTIRPYEYKTALAAPQAGRTQYLEPKYDSAGNPVLDTRERTYFNQSFDALPTYAAANGGLMAAGSMDQNNMYPQSQQVHTNFATPTQMPTSAEVVTADYDTPTNAYTGQEMPRMADGGSTNQYTYDPATQKYAEVPKAEPVEDYSNSMLFGQRGLMQNMVNQLNGQSPGAGNQWAKVMTSFAPGLAGVPQHLLNQQPNGGMGSSFGSMMSGLMQQAQNAQPNLQQYSYDPQRQQYVKMAEGGDITSGFQGYGQQDQGGRDPLELLKMLQGNQPQQQQTTVVRQASGGLSDAQYNLGSYSDGGRLLKGPGDGVSDDIPAMIGQHQPARLADNEFVIPARIVSEIGNGSTDAGAKRLYDMMDRVQAKRKKSIGKGNIAVDSKAHKELDKL